jgi:multidrug resistance protein MdtO
VRFLRFLLAELAPHPGQARMTWRTVVAVLFTALVVQALHAPHGYWAMFTVYLVSQPDAGSSVQKAVQRVVGTLAGGLLAIVTIVAFMDQPWFVLPLVFVVSAGGLFLSRIAAAPYAPYLGALTFLLFVPEAGSVTATLDAPLWRMAMILLGCVIGSVAQLVLWPDDPAALLRNDVASRLRRTAAALDRAAGARDAKPSPALLEASGLGRQLQLLESAERLHPALVHRHAEQARLIASVERALVASLAVEHLAIAPLDAAQRARIEALAVTCRELAGALAASAIAAPPATAAPAAAAPNAIAASLEQVARALAVARETLPAVIDLRHETDPAARVRLSAWLPLGVVAPGAQTPRFAARGGIATVLAYLVMHGLAWPGISTCMITPLICAEGSFGAGRQKAILRIAGATVGALLGIFTTVVLVPMATSIAGYLLVLLPSFFIASWVSMGSPRIAYAGVQIALAFAMYGESFGPTTELVVGRDRVIGIAIGIALISFLEAVLWPLYAGDQFGARLATALRALAKLARNAGRPIDPALFDSPEHWNALAAYRALTAALQVIEESRFEPGGPASDADREAALALVARAQEMMLQLVTLVRARPVLEADPDAPGAASFRTLADAHADTLTALADYLDGARATAPSLDALDRFVAETGAQEPEGRRALHRSLTDAIRELAQSPEIVRLATASARRAGAVATVTA